MNIEPMYIGIIGGGFVGGATALLACSNVTVLTYDINPERCSPVGTTLKDLLKCDFVFVCVPTPTSEAGTCDTSLVRRVVADCKAVGIDNIVVRSTVPPGTSDELGVAFMPEFLTEANWRTDFKTCPLWIFAPRHEHQRALFTELIGLAADATVIDSSSIQYVKPAEGELIKYTRNNFLAMKIGFFNEIATLSQAIGVDYDVVRRGVGADPRIGVSHTGVPGPDGHRGFGGTCLPKDTSALASFMNSKNVACPIVSAVVERNRTIDRPERDWEADPRAFKRSP